MNADVLCLKLLSLGWYYLIRVSVYDAIGQQVFSDTVLNRALEILKAMADNAE